MALDKQTLSINFSKGVDTKTDNKQVVPGKLLNLENAVLKKVGKFVKRYGYGVIAENFSISKGNALATFKNELVAYDGSYLYSYAQAGDRLYVKGDKIAVDIATQSIARNNYEQTNPDCGYHPDGLSVFAWEDSSGGVRYSVFDTATQQTIVSNAPLNGTATKPKVKVIGDYFVIFFLDGTNFKYNSIDVNSPAFLGVETTIGTGCVGYYDVTFFNSLMYVAYATGSTASIFTLDSALLQSGVLTVSATPSCLGLFNDVSNNLWCVYNEGNDLKYFIYNSSLGTQILAPTVIETGAAPFVNVTGYSDGTVGYVYYEVAGDIPSNQYVKTNNIFNNGTSGGAYEFMRSVGLYSKVFKNSDNRYFVTVTHQSDLQPTYFIVEANGSVAAKIAPALGGGLATTGLMAEVNLVSADNFLMAYEYKDFVQSVGGDVTTQTGINSVTLKYSAPILNEEIGNNLHSSGGLITAYDSQTVNELGFNLYPENYEIDYLKKGGALYQGTYGYAITYEWTDSQGQIHRSAPRYISFPIVDAETYFPIDNGYNGTPFVANIFKTPILSAPNNTIYDYDAQAQDFYIGQKVNTSWSGDVVIKGIWGFRNFGSQLKIKGFVNYSTPSSLSGTMVGLPELNYDATATLGSKTINLSQVPFLSYVATINLGSDYIQMPNTKGITVGMMLLNEQTSFIASGLLDFIKVIEVTDQSIRVNVVATSQKTNIILHIGLPVKGDRGTDYQKSLGFTNNAGDYTVTIDLATDHNNYFVGQKLYAVRFGFYQNVDPTTNNPVPIAETATLTSIVKNPTTWNLTFTRIYSLGVPGDWYTVGIFPAKDLYEKQVLNMSNYFSNPVEVQSFYAVPGEVCGSEVTLNKTASGSGGINFSITSFATPSLQLDTLRITEKQNTVINVYRTIKNGSVYYQVSPINGINNDTTVDYITFSDTTPDELIIGNQQLYTTGGEVENIAPPAGDIIGTYRNRLLVVPNEDPISFWYSKQVRTNTPIEFNDSFVQRVPEKGGPITALQQMDDKLIIFKQDYVFVMVGDGPSVSGVNNDFTDPQLITADAGCLDKKSVVILPTGVIYKSQKGFYLLDRALNVKYIGADVESFNGITVTSAVMNETENQVRFTLASGDTLVYDYYVEQWAVFKDIDAADAVNFQDKYTYLVPTGEIRKENAGFTDDGDFVPMKIETGWLNLAGLQNYQRIYHIMLVGSYKSPHTLQVQLYRDFIETPYETVTIPVTVAPTKYQYRIFPSIQKCEAIKIKITELQSSPYGEGFDISAVNIELGVKRGQNKISPDESYG